MLIRDVPTSERVHSNDEVTAIMNELHRKQKARPKYSSVWALEMQILMGLRRGEIPPLTWDDVSDTQICICKEQLTSGNDFIVVGHTKNYKDRYFPITTDLHDFWCVLKSGMKNTIQTAIICFLPTTKTESLQTVLYILFIREYVKS